MRKLIFISMCIAICLTIVACTFDDSTYYWTFEQPAEEIETVQIVNITQNYYTYDVVSELDKSHFDSLINEIQSLEMHKYGLNPSIADGKCFLIKFKNGDYDIVTFREPQHFYYDEDGTLTNAISWLKCKEPEEFDKLINKYLS